MMKKLTLGCDNTLLIDRGSKEEIVVVEDSEYGKEQSLCGCLQDPCECPFDKFIIKTVEQQLCDGFNTPVDERSFATILRKSVLVADRQFPGMHRFGLIGKEHTPAHIQKGCCGITRCDQPGDVHFTPGSTLVLESRWYEPRRTITTYLESDETLDPERIGLTMIGNNTLVDTRVSFVGDIEASDFMDSDILGKGYINDSELIFCSIYAPQGVIIDGRLVGKILLVSTCIFPDDTPELLITHPNDAMWYVKRSDYDKHRELFTSEPLFDKCEVAFSHYFTGTLDDILSIPTYDVQLTSSGKIIEKRKDFSDTGYSRFWFHGPELIAVLDDDDVAALKHGMERRYQKYVALRAQDDVQ